MKRYACHRLYLSPGQYLKQAVVTLDEEGKVCHYSKLEKEIHSTEWIGGVIILSSHSVSLPSGNIHEWLENNDDKQKYAWHLSQFDFEKETATSQSILRRL